MYRLTIKINKVAIDANDKNKNNIYYRKQYKKIMSLKHVLFYFETVDNSIAKQYYPCFANTIGTRLWKTDNIFI